MLGNIAFHNEHLSVNTFPMKNRKRSETAKDPNHGLIQMSQKGTDKTDGSSGNIISRWFNPLSNNDKIYYMRIFLALLTAVINTFLGLVELTGVILAVFMLIVSHFAAVFIFDIDPEEMGGHFKMLTIGLFSYLLIGLVVWVILYNVFVIPSLLAG